MEIERRQLYRAIIDMAYVVAKADRSLSAEERIAFSKIVNKELEYKSWAAQSLFELLDEVTRPSQEVTYNEAIQAFKKYKPILKKILKPKA